MDGVPVRPTARWLLLLTLMSTVPSCVAPTTEYRRASLAVGDWLEACAIQRQGHTVWPADPKQRNRTSTNLYHGTAGVVLFFLEAYATTGEQRYLGQARAGADSLLTTLSPRSGREAVGLYTGVAGTGFTLHEVFKATGNRDYLVGARRCVEVLQRQAQTVGAGIQWNDTTDIIRGSAGIGLFLLYASTEMKDTSALPLADGAGRRLLELGRTAGTGRKWAMRPRYARLMPNFSHGTAGVCYFLANLYQATGKREFLDGALDGARYLQSISDEGCLVFHDEPGGEQLFYLGWCHGPAGTARLFYRLHQITGERAWFDWVERAADTVMASGIPERRTPGFWNNVGMCCGSAGVADFFLDLHRVTGKPDYLAFSKRVTGDLLARGTWSDEGICWIQAEHRVRPELLQAQTGWAQGAAGIGLWLLKLDAFERGAHHRIQLPDSPFVP